MDAACVSVASKSRCGVKQCGMPDVASYMQNSVEASNCAAASSKWAPSETTLLMAVASAHKAWTAWSSSCWSEGQICG